MFGLAGSKTNMKISAYTMAEMLVVMAIIIMVFLALPSVTKKVFKVNETRKAHGRFECYWDNDKLMSYTVEENGRKILKESEKATQGICEYKPTINPLYFMIHAVGGGGAGAQLESGTSLSDPVLTTAVSNLHRTSQDIFPDWVKYVNKGEKNTATIPWWDATANDLRSQFDVGKVSYQQQIQYRLGGTAGQIVSMFTPAIPGSVTIEMKPGKGGALVSTGEGTGKDGDDTKVTFVYSDGTRHEVILAKGGVGGRGTVKGKNSMMLIGGMPTDFKTTLYTSVMTKDSGFLDIANGEDSSSAMRSKVPSTAGRGGCGQTQFVEKTNGIVFYEWDDVDKINGTGRRIGSKWTSITNKVSTPGVYNYSGLNSVCHAENCSSIEVEREGYCEYSDTSTDEFDCTIGYNNSGMGGTDISDKECPASAGDKCEHFTIKYDYTTETATISPNPISEGDGYKFYGCKFDFMNLRLRCKTTLHDVRIHNCAGMMNAGHKYKCSNGDWTTGSDDKMTCPAQKGGDGAVVIIW